MRRPASIVIGIINLFYWKVTIDNEILDGPFTKLVENGTMQIELMHFSSSSFGLSNKADVIQQSSPILSVFVVTEQVYVTTRSNK